jgi:hypothetical protein
MHCQARARTSISRAESWMDLSAADMLVLVLVLRSVEEYCRCVLWKAEVEKL